MRIAAIRNYEHFTTCSKVRNNTPKLLSEPVQDSVSFSGKKAVKGAGLGALIGLGALAILSGGAAAPIAYAAYAATMGTAGGMLGHAIDKTNDENQKDKK